MTDQVNLGLIRCYPVCNYSGSWGYLPIDVVVAVVVSIVGIFINSDSSDATFMCSGKFSSTAIPSSNGI